MKILLLVLIIIIQPYSLNARLNESKEEATARYGSPVKLAHFLAQPLHKNIQEFRYLHQGWLIRSAFLEDRTVIISYNKLVEPSSSDVYIKKDEINAILKAESNEYKWIKAKSGNKFTPSLKFQKLFKDASIVWKRGDGTIAGIIENRTLIIVSKEAIRFDMIIQNEVEKNIPIF